ncbi:hypothetical protein ACFLU6_10900 [Acidobacteriota bacterium]
MVTPMSSRTDSGSKRWRSLFRPLWILFPGQTFSWEFTKITCIGIVFACCPGQPELEVGVAENVNVTLGKFFANFGTLNRWHPHAYPTADTPPALENVFGEEPFAGIGASLAWLMPPVLADYNELSFEVVNGDNERLFSGEGFKHPVAVVHFKNYFDLNKATYFEFGLSGTAGENDPDANFMTYMEGVDISLVWSPPEKLKYKGVEARGELFFTQRDTPDGVRKTFNALSFVDIKFRQRWSGGARFDYVEDPHVDVESSYGAAAFLTFWQSEFVRIRFNYAGLNLHQEKWRHRGILQVTFALGPHKHEKY